MDTDYFKYPQDHEIDYVYSENGTMITVYKKTDTSESQTIKASKGTCKSLGTKKLVMDRKLVNKRDGEYEIQNAKTGEKLYGRSSKNGNASYEQIYKKARLTAKKIVREQLLTGKKLAFCKDFLAWNEPKLKYCNTITGYAREITKSKYKRLYYD